MTTGLIDCVDYVSLTLRQPFSSLDDGIFQPGRQDFPSFDDSLDCVD